MSSLYLTDVLNRGILVCCVHAFTERFTNISLLLLEFHPLLHGFYGLVICDHRWPAVLILMPVRNRESEKGTIFERFGIAFAFSVQRLWIIYFIYLLYVIPAHCPY
jgi:hypothetical protein